MNLESVLFMLMFQLSIDIGNEVRNQNKMLGDMVSDLSWWKEKYVFFYTFSKLWLIRY